MTLADDDVADGRRAVGRRPAPRRRVPWATLLTIALAAVVVWGVLAGIGSSGSPDRVRDITSRLRCPVCQGESVAESPSQNAQEITALVRQQVAAGSSDARDRAVLRRPLRRLDPPRPAALGAHAAAVGRAAAGGHRRGDRPRQPAAALVAPHRAARRRGDARAGQHGRPRGRRGAGADRPRQRRRSARRRWWRQRAGRPSNPLDAVTDEQMEEQIAKTPNVIGMRLALVERYLDEGKIDDAFRHTQVAINSPGTDQELEKAYRLHGWVLALMGSPTLGADYLRAALDAQPRRSRRDVLPRPGRAQRHARPRRRAGGARPAAHDRRWTTAQRAHLDALQHDIDAARAAPRGVDAVTAATGARGRRGRRSSSPGSRGRRSPCSGRDSSVAESKLIGKPVPAMTLPRLEGADARGPRRRRARCR